MQVEEVMRSCGGAVQGIRESMIDAGSATAAIAATETGGTKTTASGDHHVPALAYLNHNYSLGPTQLNSGESTKQTWITD